SILLFFFFFSSRRRHTRLQGDWSSDVCSSDLCAAWTIASGDAWIPVCGRATPKSIPATSARARREFGFGRDPFLRDLDQLQDERSEERRVGKEGRSRWVS